MYSLSLLQTVVKRVAFVVLVADMVHCYRFISNYYLDDDIDEEEKRALEEALVQRYRNDCEKSSLVSDEEFEASLLVAKETAIKMANGADNTSKYRLNHPAMKINRESVGFTGGGRAAFMQLAHPFVAAGIRDHSYLQRGVKRRFFNTFKYMFGLIFGSDVEVMDSARGIRRLHAKVHGEIGEDVGAFSEKSRFDANQKDAMRYVQWTLVETAIFEYELHVGWLSDEEKDCIAQQSAKLLLLFGVPEEEGDDVITWKQYRNRLRCAVSSKVVSISDTALDTQEYLLLPPSPIYAPLMNYVKWSTLVSLPPALGLEFGGRMYNTFTDRLAFAVVHGMVRFIYRLTPGSFRYLSVYWKMYERVHGPRNPLARLMSALSARITLFLVDMMMPDRDAEKARQMVKEVRSKRAASAAV